MITKEQVRAFVATPKGKLAVACAGLLLCWIFLLVYFFGDTISAFGDSQSLEKAKKELARQSAENAKVRIRYNELARQKKRYRAIVDSAWKENREEQVKNKLHNSITAAAAKLEFKLSRIGSVKIDRLNSKLYCAEVDITAAGKLDEIINLIAAMEEILPAIPDASCLPSGLYALIAVMKKELPSAEWKQVVIRPDNRPRPQTTSGIDSLNLANQIMTVERTRVMMNGTLRVICSDEAPHAEPERKTRK